MQSKRNRSGKNSLLDREERRLAALDTLGIAAVHQAIELDVLSDTFLLLLDLHSHLGRPEEGRPGEGILLQHLLPPS